MKKSFISCPHISNTIEIFTPDGLMLSEGVVRCEVREE